MYGIVTRGHPCPLCPSSIGGIQEEVFRVTITVGGSPSHYAFSSRTRLFEEQWEAALLSRAETTDHLWALGWCVENWRY